MKKWHVTIHCTIQAETRSDVWKIGAELCEKHLRDLAYVFAVSSDPVGDYYIAVNEPIRKRKG